MENTIFLFYISLISTVWVTWSVNAKRRAVWFDRLPNESLAGVPLVILRNEKYYPKLKEFYLNMFGRTNGENHVLKVRKQKLAQEVILKSVPFPCNVNNSRSVKRPWSVHELKPGDVDVVAAMGDSLTAGNGGFALHPGELVVENRGVTSMIGGQETWRTFLTLPNIIKEFNPRLIGHSLTDSFTHQNESQFNVAEIGAMSQDLPFMTRQLVKRIKKDSRVDFKNDWKLVTVMMGSNNFCSDLCYLSDAFTSVNSHKEDLIKSFQFLRDNMPRTIVNLIVSPNLKLLLDFKGVPSRCNFLHLFECPCLYALQYKHRLKEFFQVMSDWQRAEEEVANDERFKYKDDFTVILQTFTKNVTFPLKRNAAGEVVHDLSYLSHDCFHFSQKGYFRAANALWNNMLEPVGSKSINWSPEFQKFLCPTEAHPYIFTWKNSRT